MIDPIDVENGQVFRPFANNASELIRCTAGRWERSIDAGKSYSYTPAMQEKNKADALAPESMRIVKPRINRLSAEEIEAEYQAHKANQKFPLSQRKTLSVHNPFALISANSGTIEEDIDDALETGEIEKLVSTVRSIVRDHLEDNPKFNAVAYITVINQRVTVAAKEKDLKAPHLAGLFEYGRAVVITSEIAALVSTTEDIRQTDPIPDNVAPPPPPSTPTPPGFDTYIVEEHRRRLMPYLTGIYTNKKPREITAMLYALEVLEVLTGKVDECDQTDLHSALTHTFGNVGGRTALNAALPLYHKDSIDTAKRQKVEHHKLLIKAFLKPEQTR